MLSRGVAVLDVDAEMEAAEGVPGADVNECSGIAVFGVYIGLSNGCSIAGALSGTGGRTGAWEN